MTSEAAPLPILVGIVEDDPEVALEYVDDILQGYLNEVLASTGVAWIDAHAELPEHANGGAA